MIEDKSPYGLQINNKACIQTISLDVLEKWKSVLRNAERQLIELLLTVAKVVSYVVEDTFERKLREMFTENFRVARNKVKQQSETLVTALRNKLHKKWLNGRRKESDCQSSRDNVKEFEEQVKDVSFANVTCNRERRKKTKENMLNVLINRKRTPPPDTGMINFTPCGNNEKSNASCHTNYSNSKTISSNINEVTKAILNFFIQKFNNYKKAQTLTSEQK